MSSTSASSPDTDTRKGTLICQSCDRTAPLDDGWTVREVSLPDRRRRIRCPDCGALVVDQPVYEPDSPASPWTRAVRAWIRSGTR